VFRDGSVHQWVCLAVSVLLRSYPPCQALGCSSPQGLRFKWHGALLPANPRSRFTLRLTFAQTRNWPRRARAPTGGRSVPSPGAGLCPGKAGIQVDQLVGVELAGPSQEGAGVSPERGCRQRAGPYGPGPSAPGTESAPTARRPASVPRCSRAGGYRQEPEEVLRHSRFRGKSRSTCATHSQRGRYAGRFLAVTATPPPSTVRARARRGPAPCFPWLSPCAAWMPPSGSDKRRPILHAACLFPLLLNLLNPFPPGLYPNRLQCVV
jgi:hypothetical protein